MITPTETCPSSEDIAAFLDGKLLGEERARIIAHLNECDSCYATFADTAVFLLDEGQEGSTPEEASEPAGTVVPFPRRKTLTWAASIAAMLLIGVTALGIYRQYNEMPVLVASELIDPRMPVTGEAIDRWAERMRGGDSAVALTDSPAEFLLGANLVDLRLRLARNEGEAEQVLIRINQQMPNLLVVPEEAKFYEDARDRIVQGTPPKNLLAEADRVEASLTEFLAPATYLAFGKWTEAGRLSAEAREADFFQDRENRRFLRWLLRNAEEEGLDSEVVSTLHQIQGLLEEEFRERAFLKATAHLQAVLDHYQNEALPGSGI